jgi:hypothetical protein
MWQDRITKVLTKSPSFCIVATQLVHITCHEEYSLIAKSGQVHRLRKNQNSSFFLSLIGLYKIQILIIHSNPEYKIFSLIFKAWWGFECCLFLHSHSSIPPIIVYLQNWHSTVATAVLLISWMCNSAAQVNQQPPMQHFRMRLFKPFWGWTQTHPAHPARAFLFSSSPAQGLFSPLICPQSFPLLP